MDVAKRTEGGVGGSRELVLFYVETNYNCCGSRDCRNLQQIFDILIQFFLNFKVLQTLETLIICAKFPENRRKIVAGVAIGKKFEDR